MKLLVRIANSETTATLDLSLGVPDQLQEVQTRVFRLFDPSGSFITTVSHKIKVLDSVGTVLDELRHPVQLNPAVSLRIEPAGAPQNTTVTTATTTISNMPQQPVISETLPDKRSRGEYGMEKPVHRQEDSGRRPSVDRYREFEAKLLQFYATERRMLDKKAAAAERTEHHRDDDHSPKREVPTSSSSNAAYELTSFVRYALDLLKFFEARDFRDASKRSVRELHSSSAFMDFLSIVANPSGSRPRHIITLVDGDHYMWKKDLSALGVYRMVVIEHFRSIGNRPLPRGVVKGLSSARRFSDYVSRLSNKLDEHYLLESVGDKWRVRPDLLEASHSAIVSAPAAEAEEDSRAAKKRARQSLRDELRRFFKQNNNTPTPYKFLQKAIPSSLHSLLSSYLDDVCDESKDVCYMKKNSDRLYCIRDDTAFFFSRLAGTLSGCEKKGQRLTKSVLADLVPHEKFLTFVEEECRKKSAEHPTAILSDDGPDAYRLRKFLSPIAEDAYYYGSVGNFGRVRAIFDEFRRSGVKASSGEKVPTTVATAMKPSESQRKEPLPIVSANKSGSPGELGTDGGDFVEDVVPAQVEEDNAQQDDKEETSHAHNGDHQQQMEVVASHESDDDDDNADGGGVEIVEYLEPLASAGNSRAASGDMLEL